MGKRDGMQTEPEILRLFAEHRYRMIQELKALFFADAERFTALTESLIERNREFREYYYYDLAWQMRLHRWRERKKRREALRMYLQRWGLVR